CSSDLVARDPANWWRNIRIDLGKRDGVRVDFPVRIADGLIGRVSEVSETSSRVVLLGDANCRVPVEIIDAQTGRTVDKGVITGGASVLDESMVELSFLSTPGAVRPGQAVRTSGYSAIFPPGIFVGQVVDTRPVEF